MSENTNNQVDPQWEWQTIRWLIADEASRELAMGQVQKYIEKMNLPAKAFRPASAFKQGKEYAVVQCYRTWI